MKLSIYVPQPLGIQPFGTFKASLAALSHVESLSHDERVAKYVEIFDGWTNKTSEHLAIEAETMPAALLSFIIADTHYGEY